MDPSCFVKGAVGVGILLGGSRDHDSTEVKGFSAMCDREEFKNVRSCPIFYLKIISRVCLMISVQSSNLLGIILGCSQNRVRAGLET